MLSHLRLSGTCLLFAGGIGYLTLSSNSNGITGQSTAGCSCHGGTSTSTLINISGIPNTGWVPGTAYPLTISVNNSGAAYTRAGFDLTANIGTFTAAGMGASLNGTTEVYHNTPKVLGGGSASWEVTWTAPANGATALSFSCAGNAVNTNGTTSGDAHNQSTTTYTAASTAGSIAITSPATALTTTTATLNGTVNAGGNSSTVTFEWGTTMALGQSVTATPATVTGSNATAVSATLSGLQPGTLYHFQVKSTGSTGVVTGSYMMFTTVPLSVGSLSQTPVVISPNPATTALHIALNVPPAALKAWAVSITGTRVQLPLAGGKEVLKADISALPAGAYFLLLEGSEKYYSAAFQKR